MDKISRFLKENLSEHSADIVNFSAKHLGVTRTTVHRHLNKLIKNNEVVKSGKTRDVKYYLTHSLNKKAKFSIHSGVQEFNVYRDYLDKAFAVLPENVQVICHYGFTEIFNNALDHSRGTTIWIESGCIENQLTLTVIDDGVGVFKTIFDFFKLDNMRETVLQLSKGKMTTAPDRHTGEGLFFSSKAFDVLEIFANGIHYLRSNIEGDWTLESCNTSQFGSKVVMRIAINADRDLVDVFRRYRDPEDLSFDRTDILVKLSLLKQEQLISRSQAKRILQGLETRFKLVTLDFSGVKFVGQGFADEIFRVYKNEHPEVTFQYVNANEDVEFMIKRSIATAG